MRKGSGKSGRNKDEIIFRFQGAVREAAALKENFKNCWLVASSKNGWINEELTLLYLKKVIGPFTSKRVFWLRTPLKLIWRSHLADALNTSGCTKYIQVPGTF